MASLRTEILSMRLDGVLSLCVGSTQLNQVTEIEKDLKQYDHGDSFVTTIANFDSRLTLETMTKYFNKNQPIYYELSKKLDYKEIPQHTHLSVTVVVASVAVVANDTFVGEREAEMIALVEVEPLELV